MRLVKFDYLVGLSLLLFVAINVFAYSSWGILSDDVKKLLSFDGYGSYFEALGLYVWAVFLILNLFAYVGLFLRKRWGGILFVVLHLAMFMSSFVGGVRVFHGAEYALTHVALLVDGVIIAIFFGLSNRVALDRH